MADARHFALRELYSGDDEARRYLREGYLYFALIHLHLIAVLMGWLPRWSLPLLLPIWMARLMIGRHELIHVRRESDVDPFTRLWPVLMMLTPISAGFREYRILHQRHHQYMLTNGDPDLYQIRGSKLAGFFHCFVSPEVTLWKWVADRGLDRALLGQLFARAAFFYTVLWFSDGAFLWYWVPLRVTYGCALFLFSYLLHRRGERYGVFRIDLPPAGVQLFCFLFGRAGWLAVCNHDVHHMNGNLSPLKLIEARDIVGAAA